MRLAGFVLLFTSLAYVATIYFRQWRLHRDPLGLKALERVCGQKR